MIYRVAVFALGSVVFLLAGCSGPSVSPSHSPGGQIGPAGTKSGGTSLAGLRKGMLSNEVRVVLGEPDEIKPFKTGEIGVYVWTYRRIVEGPVREVIAGTRDLPAINPITGQPTTIQDPIYKQEVTYLHETIELLMQGNTLVEWKRHAFERREFR
jgi:hypothetical protein